MVDPVVFPPYSSEGWHAEEDLLAIVGTTDSGGESRLQRWLQYRRTYSIPWDKLGAEDRIALRNFKRLRRGVVRGFLLIDVFECYFPGETIGVGNGSAKAFQLTQTIADPVTSLVRAIRYTMPTGTTLPYNVRGYAPGQTVAQTLVTVGGAARTEGTHFTVSPTTGVVTFATAPPAGQPIVATFWAYVPVRFSDSKSSVTMGTILGSRTDDLIEVLFE